MVLHHVSWDCRTVRACKCLLEWQRACRPGSPRPQAQPVRDAAKARRFAARQRAQGASPSSSAARNLFSPSTPSPAAVAAGVSPQAQMVDCSPNCAQTGPVQRAGPWSGLVELQQEQLRPLPGFIKWRQVRRGVLGLLHVLPVLSGRLPISHG